MEEHSKQNNKHVLIAFGIVFFVFSLILINRDFNFISSLRVSEQGGISQGKDGTSDTVKNNSSNTFSFPEYNYEFTIPPNWKVVSTSTINIPDQINNVVFALENENLSCVLIYSSDIEKPNFGDVYKQTSFGQRIFTQDNNQIDGRWYVKNEYLPDNFEFVWHGRYPIHHEISQYYYPSGVFYLFNNDGGIVANDCDSDLFSMLSSLIRKYDSTSITNNTNGTLFLTRENFMLISSDDNIERKAVTIASLSEPEASVYKNKMYFVSSNGSDTSGYSGHDSGKLKVLDIFSGKIDDVAGVILEKNEVVNEFYIYKDRLFYLVGESCTSYRASCNNKLYELNLQTHLSNFLASNVKSREIKGYDLDRNILVMMYADGDAGCWWGTQEEYSFNSHSIEIGDGLGGCDGDPGFEDSLKKRNDMNKKFSTQFVRTPYLLINHGQIRPNLDPRLLQVHSSKSGLSVSELRYFNE